MGSYKDNDLAFDEAYFEPLGHDVWLMDDHKWAFYVWEQYRGKLREKDRFELVHMDFHWDGVNDFQEPGEQAALITAPDNNALIAMITEDIGYIRKDSFIAAAIIRGLLKQVRFHCLQKDTDPGIDSSLLKAYSCEQVMYANVVDLLKNINYGNSIICDLCLDLFNKSEMWEEGDLWTDDEVIQYMELIAPIVNAATVCTVSLSFGYSGTAADTRHLMQLVVPRILAIRST